MEILIWCLFAILLIVLALVVFFLYQLRRDMREISQSLDCIEDSFNQITDALVILAYLVARERHLELVAGMETKAIEAAKRMKFRQNLITGGKR